MSTTGWQADRVVPGAFSAAARQAPWDKEYVWRRLQSQYKFDPPSAEVWKGYEKLLDYDVNAMIRAIPDIHDDDDGVQRLAERICDIDVEQCAAQADYLATLDRAEAAERMWRRALAESKDQIALSNNLGRYVGLLLDHGQVDEALRVARLAADVYSAVGLFTLAVAYERLGRFDDAAREYAKITERYESKERENTFYVRYRQRHGGDRFQREVELATAELFPKGLLRKAAAVFQHEGHRGGVFLGEGRLPERLRRVGLRYEDFLVAIDGFAVENDAQMNAVLTFTDDPTLTAIVFRHGPVLELKGPYHRWGYGLVTAKPSG
jgi:tetratricopeptide (TPR) repeat protein